MQDNDMYGEAGPKLSQSCRSVLAEPVHYLDANISRLVSKWTELYLTTFGRKSFFSPERVTGIFNEIATVFLLCLKKSNFEGYFAMLEERGKYFCALGVPFEEVVLCLHLFEESYLSLILENKSIVKHNAEEIILAFEELHNLGTAVFATSYFRTVKKDWQSVCRGYQEENGRLRAELSKVRDDFFTSTKNELNSMELMIQGINRKLRKSVVRSRRVQMFAELLDKESNLKNLLRIADRFLRQVLPHGSRVAFGLFEEDRRKLLLYALSGEEDGAAPEVVDEIFFSQLGAGYQEALFSEAKGPVSLHEAHGLPAFAGGLSDPAGTRDFLFLPLIKFHDPMGFLWLSSSEPDIFGKQSVKYYQRLAAALTKALFAVVYFNRHKKHAEFVSILDQFDERVLQRNPLEATLDFCLGSMIELLDVERASLMMLDKKTKTLGITAAKGYKVYPFSGLTLKWGEGVAGWSVKESKIVAIPRMKTERNDASFAPPRPVEVPQLGVRSLLCVPLLHQNEPIGVINLSTLSYHKNFEQSEIDMVQRFAQRISSALNSLATIKDFETLMKPYL